MGRYMAMKSIYDSWGRLFRACVRFLCASIHLPPATEDASQAVPAVGPQVFVTRGDSTWLALAFLDTLARQGVHDIYFLGGVRLWWYRPWAPVWQACKRLLRKPKLSDRGPASDIAANVAIQAVLAAIGARFGRRAEALAEHVAAGRKVAVVLPVARGRGGPIADWTDYMCALLSLQTALAQPIVVWPHLLVTREQSGKLGTGVLDWLLGDSRKPGWLRHWTMLLVLRHGSMRRSEPLDLRAYAEAQGSTDLPAQARALRRELHHRMDEEQRVVAGPALSDFEEMARQVLQAPSLRAAIAQQAQSDNQPEVLLEVQTARRLRRLTANYDVRVIRMMEHLLFYLFHRIYDGIVIDEPGLAKVIEASRRAPVVFCPSHKSHVDYLVLSFVLWTHGIAPPHVAAGANLNFFPIGALFRRCGAFFLQRSFRDDPVYAALMRNYLAYLVRAGTSIEFFLEGTRSRSGKLLPPKFGMLRMLVDAWRDGAREDLLFVPVSIDYDRIMEAGAYRLELKGASKRAETFRGLLGSSGLLGRRYGRLHVQFGEPISMQNWTQGRSLDDENKRRQQTERLGFRILHDVAMVCSVTPTNVVCTALLGHVGRGMAQGTLISRSLAILDFLQAVSARLVGPLAIEEARISAVLDAVQKLVDENMVSFESAGASDQERIYFVTEEARLSLDYHKNAIMNYFASAAVISRALLRRKAGRNTDPNQPADDSRIYERTHADAQFLSHLFKREFIFRVDGDLTRSFDETLGAMGLFGLLRIDASGAIYIEEPETIAHLAALLDNYLQAYRIAAEAALDLRAMELTQKDFVARAIERARRAYLEGVISRPETASRTLMETALSWLMERGILTQSDGRKTGILRIGDTGAQQLRGIIDGITPYL